MNTKAGRLDWSAIPGRIQTGIVKQVDWKRVLVYAGILAVDVVLLVLAAMGCCAIAATLHHALRNGFSWR